jgi:transcriptional regulator with XRE-family HTH domain
MSNATTIKIDIPSAVSEVLKAIEKPREKEIVTRRFGLFDRKQTLEEIGNLLGITRERVRQIEKQVVNRLSEIKHTKLDEIRDVFTEAIEEMGRVVPVTELADRFELKDQSGHAQVSFLARLMPEFEVIADNDHFHHSVALKQHHDSDKLHQLVSELVAAVKKLEKPATIEEIQAVMNTKLEVHHLHGLARSAKNVTSLENRWGLLSNPLVHPKSIRDKIYVILQKHGKPMHFSEISEAIKNSDFKRRNVTTQAIHNELIKDDRFVLVGRGIYALSEWGYSQGTVADVIQTILEKESPLHRDEIVKRVLDQRHVKATTIILNLQGKKQFKRVAKATYALAG